MPEMYEIYERHADWYDRLVGAEDYMGNLRRTLARVGTWHGAKVYEAGVGTGRITKLYLDWIESATLCDRSTHMLDKARKNLAHGEEKLTYLEGDNFALPPAETGPADIVIEGWAFGHGVVDRAEEARAQNGSVSAAVAQATKELLVSARKVLKPKGRLILLETMGTATDGPQAPLPELALFYELLQERLGFKHEVITTDYQFASAKEAETVMGFFFGEEMGAKVRAIGSGNVPEWTGVWWASVK